MTTKIDIQKLGGAQMGNSLTEHSSQTRQQPALVGFSRLQRESRFFQEDLDCGSACGGDNAIPEFEPLRRLRIGRVDF
ncbi:hypothetical protein [Rhizobium sp. Rhizsp42]|uniref:hypothetical protein n=1 Tax=Rhizobium sp. Rhizsp42 TaxID=3243034 RepID=UPI0039AECA49